MNDKERELMRDLEMTEAGRKFLENAELPKHTNPLPIKADNEIKPYEKINAILIPKGATNGDMIKAMFPNIEIEGIGGLEGLQCVAVGIGLGTSFFALDWWNAPFKKEVEE